MTPILGFILIIVCLLLWIIYQKNKLNIYSSQKKRHLQKINDMTEVIDEFNEVKTDFVYSKNTLDFLDRIILTKYNFYMYTELMPIYLDHKVPEKRIISELKEKIYVSVVGGLTAKTKKSVLDLLTSKGVEIYVHERIMILMNETDFKTSGKYAESFRDLNPRKMDGIIP